MEDIRISKQRLNVIMLVDASTSMRGVRINQVNQAIRDVKDYLIDLEGENANVDFYLSVITFSTDAFFKTGKKMTPVSEFEFDDISAKGQSNIEQAYGLLSTILDKESKGGIMPDFGGVAPIILLLTDGHPGKSYKKQLDELLSKPWFRVALRYGIAVELNDKRTNHVLKDFVGENGDVIDCYDARLLKQIIKIIVLTASKVKSSATAISNKHHQTPNAVSTQAVIIKQQIEEALNDVEDWEW